jgi:hypothetical protein
MPLVFQGACQDRESIPDVVQGQGEFDTRRRIGLAAAASTPWIPDVESIPDVELRETTPDVV